MLSHAPDRNDLLSCVLLYLSVSIASGSTLSVPSQYATIQAAIDVAVHGDVIELADGVYSGVGNKNLDFLGKAIVLRSASGDPDHCVIDCEGEGHGIRIQSGEGRHTIVDGLTVTGGVRRHSPNDEGGGMSVEASSPTILNCVFEDNIGSHGGGVSVSGGEPMFVNCRIINNRSLFNPRGGGFYNYQGHATLVNCEISGNHSLGGGGGYYALRSQNTLINCVIQKNKAESGGGIRAIESTVNLSNCAILDNDAQTGSNLYGYGYGGASEIELANCIVRGDPNHMHASNSIIAAEYCNISGGWPGIGNIDVDPQFAFPGDLHLMGESLCIDAGTDDPNSVILPNSDADTNPRSLDGDGDGIATVDMGVYEFDPNRPSIALCATAFEFVDRLDGETAAAQTLSLRNCGSGTLNWQIDGIPEWLTVSPAAGTSSGAVQEVTIATAAAALPHGVYVADLYVVDPAATNSSRKVTVTLYRSMTHHVPAAYPTIQAAIEASFDHDIVALADGVFRGVGNRALDFGGRAITVRSASGIPARCVIDCEQADQAFYFHSEERADSIVAGITITHGKAPIYGYGGAVHCDDHASPTFNNCVFTKNTARVGGAVRCDTNCDATFHACVFTGNIAEEEGGAIQARYNQVVLTNCLIYANTAEEGSGVFCGSLGSVRMTNCTVMGNISSRGAGLEADFSGALIMSNCVVRDNSPLNIDFDEVDPLVTYSNIGGGWPGIGNIDLDPLFALDSDFHLLTGSPCIDAGTNDPPGGLPANDLEGLSRPLDGDRDSQALADMGAYEFDPNRPAIALSLTRVKLKAVEGQIEPAEITLSIRNAGVGTLNWQIAGQPDWLTATPAAGDSTGEVDEVLLSVDASELAPGDYSASLEIVDPAAANSTRHVQVSLTVAKLRLVPSEYATIQTAIDAANAGDVVELADGTYTGYGNTRIRLRGKRLTMRSASGDPATCIIDCGRYDSGFMFEREDGPEALVQRISIINGGRDGGVNLERYAAPTLVNCVIRDCTGGPGMYCDYYSAPTLVDCTIENCRGYQGGGIYCRDGVTATLINCVIRNCYANYGGGMYSIDADLTLVNSVITGNTSDYDGGGLMIAGFGDTQLLNCEISHNRILNSGAGAGVYFDVGTSVSVINCTITDNACNPEDSASGGGIHARHNNMTLANCVIWGNYPDAIYYFPDKYLTASYCNIQGGTGEAWFGPGCVDVEPAFVDPDGTDNDPLTWEDNDYRLTAFSPAVDAGDNASLAIDWVDLDGDGIIVEPIPFDRLGNPRVVNAVVDLGAYEYVLLSDVNGDGLVDWADFVDFDVCCAGPSQLVEAACETVRIDKDTDVDLADFYHLQYEFAGP